MAPLNGVVAPDIVTRLADPADESRPYRSFGLIRRDATERQNGCDRYRDIDGSIRTSVDSWMERVSSPNRYRQLIREQGTLEIEDQSLIFGEALPKGLRIL